LVFLHFLQAERGADGICSGLSVLDRCLYNDSEQPWKTERVSPSRAEGKLQPGVIKITSSCRANVRKVCSLHIVKDLVS
jgi:hypothetical protein